MIGWNDVVVAAGVPAPLPGVDVVVVVVVHVDVVAGVPAPLPRDRGAPSRLQSRWGGQAIFWRSHQLSGNFMWSDEDHMIMYYRKLFKIINGRSVFWQSQQLSCQEGAIIKVKHVTDISLLKLWNQYLFVLLSHRVGCLARFLTTTAGSTLRFT